MADLLRSCGGYRWVGLYDVDRAGLVRNVVWSGPGAPEYPTFPVTEGLTAAAVADRRTVNVGDVASDPRYLTAFSTTRSEIIVPVFDQARGVVIGTIDIESDTANAFGADVQALLETCSDLIRPLWKTLIFAAVHPIFHACGISKVLRFKTNFSDEPVSLLPQKKLLIISQRFFGIPSGSTPENATRQSSTGAHPWLGGLRNSGETRESYTP